MDDMKTPHDVLIHYLSKVEELKGVLVVAIYKDEVPEEDRIAVHASQMADFEAIGALYAAASVKQLEFEEEQFNKMNGDEDGDGGTDV